MTTNADVDGLLIVDKPKGITSHDLVSIVRKRLSTRKVGHAGTLDPMATGLMLLGVGKATRLLRYLSGLDKTYEGTGLLGVRTDTLDAEGEVVGQADPAGVTLEGLCEAASLLTGEIVQIPPVYSAIKVDGEALHRSARRGDPKEAPPRTVLVPRFEVQAPQLPAFDISVDCSSGTYVRTLVADLGDAVGCGAHLTRLRRTRIGPFDIRDARLPEDISVPLPVERAVAHLPRLDLDEYEAQAAGFGRPLGPAGIVGSYGVYGPDGRLIGIYVDEPTKAVPEMILAVG